MISLAIDLPNPFFEVSLTLTEHELLHVRVMKSWCYVWKNRFFWVNRTAM